MIRRPTTPNGRSYVVSVAGTSGGSEPAWPVTQNGAVVDGAVTWLENTYVVRFAQPVSYKPDIIGMVSSRWNVSCVLEAAQTNV